MRVTNQWIINSFVRSINKNHNELSKAQIQISSGKSYATASENPVNNALAMQHKTEIYEHTQYITNVSRTVEWLDQTDTAMTTIESTLQRARELAVQGANDTLVQADRDAIAREIDQLMLHLIDTGNTDIGGEYLFAGNDVKTKPFEKLDGQRANAMKDIVTYSYGVTRANLNLSSPLDVLYKGDNLKTVSEIEKGVILERSLTGMEVFYGSNSLSPQPTFDTLMPPLSKMMSLQALNNGQGVQAGVIMVTDSNGLDTAIDLKSARTIDDVIQIINLTRSFEAGFEEVPSQAAEALGLLRNAGRDSLLIGQSDPAMLSTGTALSDLNGGLGVPSGYLSINTRDGKNHRVDLSTATTVQDALDLINNINAGQTVQAKYDMIHQRLELTDLTGGSGDFSVESKQNQLYIKDLPAHAASDLGLLKNVGAGNTIFSTFDSALESEATPLSFLNGGLGVERGLIDITGHDGVTRTVNLANTTTVQEVVDAINAVTGANQTASYDTVTGTIRLDDNTVGANSFMIEEVNGAAAVAVREPSTIAKRLGLLKSSQGNNLLGDSLQPGGLTAASTLASLVPAPEKGTIVLRGADGNPVEVDLAAASTIQEVLSAIDATQKFTATWDVPAQRFIITDVSGSPGSEGISVEEKTNTARDLGFLSGAINHTQETLTGGPISVKNLPTLVGSVDLNPAVSSTTTIDSLNAGRTFNQGAQLGRIRITDKAGHFIAIDLRGSKTIQDVLDKINDPANGIYIEAKINGDRNGIEIIDKNHGATGKLEIIDVDSTSAYDLGISTPPGGTVDKRWVGRDIDPAVTDTTLVSDLRVNEGGVPLGKVYVQSGEFSGEIDLSGARTVKELMEKLSLSDTNANLTAWISEDGRRINLSNTKGQPYIKVRDISEKAEEATASALGLGGSRGIFETMADLRDNLLRNDGTAISEVSIKSIQVDIVRVLKFHTEVGAKTNRATAAKEKLESFNLNLKKLLNNVEDVDMTEAITRMTQLETSFQAALSAGARVLQVTLLEFLK